MPYPPLHDQASDVALQFAGPGHQGGGFRVAIPVAEMAAFGDRRPPRDGRRLNTLSGAFTDIGMAVYRDSSSGTVWLTQDFSN